MNAIIAVNPQQMQEAQATTTSWVAAKLAAAEQDMDHADEVVNALMTRGMNSRPAKALLDKAARRVKFYEKVKAALAAGYYIIPPFDIQLFAIRTDRLAPSAKRSDSRWTSEQEARRLPVGQGRYVSPQPPRLQVATETRPYSHDPAKSREVEVYENGDWRDEIDLPVRAMKPTLIEAVGRALEQKIFDALGIAPAYRAADPIIAGQIRRPEGNGTITFFVAWWLDEADL